MISTTAEEIQPQPKRKAPQKLAAQIYLDAQSFYAMCNDKVSQNLKFQHFNIFAENDWLKFDQIFACQMIETNYFHSNSYLSYFTNWQDVKLPKINFSHVHYQLPSLQKGVIEWYFQEQILRQFQNTLELWFSQTEE